MTKTKNILIIEDELPSLNFMKAIVEEICTPEFKIHACTNLQEAYEFMENHRVILFLVDIMLENEKTGKESGYEFVKIIREKVEYQFVPVIFITGMEEPRERAYKELHCYGYIQKPFSVSTVQQMIKQCLSYPAKEQAQKLRLKKDGIILLINQSDVVYIQSARGHMYLKLNDTSMAEFAYMPLADVLKEFTEEEMLLCEKGMAVNRRYIDFIDVKEKKIHLIKNFGNINISKTYLNLATHSETDVRTQ